jgi:hypothetical protein
MTAPKAAGQRRGLTMACWLEERRDTPERKAAWHRDCVDPGHCPCEAHKNDKPAGAR